MSVTICFLFHHKCPHQFLLLFCKQLLCLFSLIPSWYHYQNNHPNYHLHRSKYLLPVHSYYIWLFFIVLFINSIIQYWTLHIIISGSREIESFFEETELCSLLNIVLSILFKIYLQFSVISESAKSLYKNRINMGCSSFTKKTSRRSYFMFF